jgi:hypothetical protein
MQMATRTSLLLAAVTGMIAGAACTSSNAPPAAAPEAEPMTEKHGCKTDANGKHACGADMSSAPEGDAPKPAAPIDSAAPTKAP